jgi:hypothetical protein
MCAQRRRSQLSVVSCQLSVVRSQGRLSSRVPSPVSCTPMLSVVAQTCLPRSAALRLFQNEEPSVGRQRIHEVWRLARTQSCALRKALGRLPGSHSLWGRFANRPYKRIGGTPR